jgi:hypothetical protein
MASSWHFGAEEESAQGVPGDTDQDDAELETIFESVAASDDPEKSDTPVKQQRKPDTPVEQHRNMDKLLRDLRISLQGDKAEFIPTAVSHRWRKGKGPNEKVALSMWSLAQPHFRSSHNARVYTRIQKRDVGKTIFLPGFTRTSAKNPPVFIGMRPCTILAIKESKDSVNVEVCRIDTGTLTNYALTENSVYMVAGSVN